MNPDAVLAQAIQEIDAAADEVRVGLGKATTERHRLDIRRQQLLREKDELAAKVRLAIDEDRDDLAEVGISRAGRYRSAGRRAGSPDGRCGRRSSQLGRDRRRHHRQPPRGRTNAQGLSGLSRRRCWRGGAATGSSGDKVSGAMTKVARAQATTARITGVPAGKPNSDAEALDELAELQRQREVRSRLERLKSGRDS